MSCAYGRGVVKRDFMDPSPQLHVPVMVEEALHALRIRRDGVYVDATAGAGGHAERIAALLSGGRLIALDRDPAAVDLSRERLANYPWATVIKANYSELPSVLEKLEIQSVDGILLDAGISSMQIDASERGFSLDLDGPLDMRMDPTEEDHAASRLARWDSDEIERILREYGDVRPAGRIARAIVSRCKANQMYRTSHLAAAVREALDFVRTEPEEIRTVFQAVRIAVNDELTHLKKGLEQAAAHLQPGGRLVVISFHSGEDRVVKHCFQAFSRVTTRLHPDGRVAETIQPKYCVITKKPLQPSREETAANSRSKSAKMRVLECIQ